MWRCESVDWQNRNMTLIASEDFTFSNTHYDDYRVLSIWSLLLRICSLTYTMLPEISEDFVARGVSQHQCLMHMINVFFGTKKIVKRTRKYSIEDQKALILFYVVSRVSAFRIDRA